MASMRVLHILARLDRGGTETWLLNVVRRLDRTQCACDFVVFAGARGAYESEIEGLGARIFRCAHPSGRRRFGRDLVAALQSPEPYDIVHSHIDPCGYPLRWAAAAGVPVRVAHAHNPGLELRRHPLWLRYALRPWTQSLIARHATTGLATGRLAGNSLFGRIRFRDWSWKVLHCGIDLAPFETSRRPRVQFLDEFCLPREAKILLHVGKFDESRQKNQEFLLRVLAEVRRSDASVWGVLAGDGSRRGAVESHAQQIGISDAVRFIGSRDDVPELLQSLADVFVFPSRFEGLGLAAVEAQAAGCPCLLSDAVPVEAVVVPELVERLPLDQGPGAWASRIAKLLKTPPAVSAQHSWRLVSNSSFNIARSAAELQEFYANCQSGNPARSAVKTT
jgi:glycosyltransferase involved in cell wall biosynthesis